MSNWLLGKAVSNDRNFNWKKLLQLFPLKYYCQQPQVTAQVLYTSNY